MLSHSLSHKELSIHQEGAGTLAEVVRQTHIFALSMVDWEGGNSVSLECFSCPENITFSFESHYVLKIVIQGSVIDFCPL